MSALPPNFPSEALAGSTGGIPPGAQPIGGSDTDSESEAVSATRLKWAALQDAAAVIAVLAGLGDDLVLAEAREFPGSIQDTGLWRRERIEIGIDDLAAIMEPGIAALLAVNARGADTRPAALALWREFDEACTALEALARPALRAGFAPRA